MDVPELLRQAGQGRRALKRLAAELDQDPLRRQQLARTLGLSEAWPAKKLLRHGLDRSGAAQVRSNPIRRDEGFSCAHCGHVTLPGGATVRDHCPRCLHSLHVDRVPGDRANPCKGLLVPTALETVAGQTLIHYRCERCGETHRNRAHPGDDILAFARRLSG